MSTGSVLLAARGIQDTSLTQNPQVTWWASQYRRHTNFSDNVYSQLIHPAPQNNSTSTVTLSREGDLVDYLFLTVHDGSTSLKEDYSSLIQKVELMIGDTTVDVQDATFTFNVAGATESNTLSRSFIGLNATQPVYMYPLKFWFCRDSGTALPLMLLQHHDVRLKIYWGSNTTNSNRKWMLNGHYYHLDNFERQRLREASPDYLITQVQTAIPTQNKIQELVFNHPIKYIASSNTTTNALVSDTNRVKFQINGKDMNPYLHSNPHYTNIACYYYTGNSVTTGASNVFIKSFCLDTSATQPTGSLNFSRIDKFIVQSETDNLTENIYAVNYNLLRIKNGMAGVVYAA